jgi:hypothetical protein
MGTGRWLAACAAAMLVAAQALPAQQTPEEVVQAYYGHYRAGELDRVVALTHPRAMESFKSGFARLMAFAADHDEDLPFGMMGDMESLPADAAYLMFMRGAGEEEGFTEILGGLQVQPLGHVMQGDSLAHVVADASPEFTGVTTRQVMVVTVRRHGAQWLVDPGDSLMGMMAAGMMPLLMAAGMEAGMTGALDEDEDHDH